MPETGFSGVSRRGEHESGVQKPRNLIGRPGANGNRVCRKQVFLEYLDAENMNLASKNLETPLVDREPMETNFSKNDFAEGYTMWGARIFEINVLTAEQSVESASNSVLTISKYSAKHSLESDGWLPA